MKFGTWNVRSLQRTGSLMAVAYKISKYKLDLVGVQGWHQTGRRIYIFLWNGE
jgi:hypothetical protein